MSVAFFHGSAGSGSDTEHHALLERLGALLSRALDALAGPSLGQIDREVELLAEKAGGRMSDELERRIADKVIGRSMWR
jgi:hypothetical protein